MSKKAKNCPTFNKCDSFPCKEYNSQGITKLKKDQKTNRKPISLSRKATLKLNQRNRSNPCSLEDALSVKLFKITTTIYSLRKEDVGKPVSEDLVVCLG